MFAIYNMQYYYETMDIKGQEVEKEGVSSSMEMYEESVLDEEIEKWSVQ